MDDFKQQYISVLNNTTFKTDNRGARAPTYRKSLSPYFTFQDGNILLKRKAS